ncbi:uncharacterized protein [Macrobrachium rosenbergii]|uniref:uncharacterized protein n=1 Tax=Macrobrachium rosenbergii TaxID=79674 RepID=UPI0034D52147
MENIGLCEAVEERLVTIPLRKIVDDFAGIPIEIEDKSQDLDGNVTTDNDNIKDTDSDSDIFAIKSAPVGASQVITDDEGPPPPPGEPSVPYTLGSLSLVGDDKNEENEEISVAASVYRNDESVDDTAEECEMDLEVNKAGAIEDELKNDDKGPDLVSEGQWNIDLETVGKLTLTKGKSIKEERKEAKMNGREASTSLVAVLNNQLIIRFKRKTHYLIRQKGNIPTKSLFGQVLHFE